VERAVAICDHPPSGSAGDCTNWMCDNINANLKYCTSASGGSCVNISNNRNNCGACGNKCSTNEICVPTNDNSFCADRGKCQSCPEAQEADPLTNKCVPKCPEGQTRDSSGQCQCIDSNKELVNGQCVDKCQAGTTRDPTTGQCQCPSGYSMCSGQCINTQSDPNNCGKCAKACGI
jgi:hypothetical protein